MSVQAACGWYGVSRQGYYQARKRQQQREAEDGLIVELVQGLRQRHPRMGGKKLYHELGPVLSGLGISRGRDRFLALLKAHDLLVGVKRSPRRTTHPGSWRYPNRLAEADITTVHQAWVGDITYLTTATEFVYLALLTDVFSRFIVGYDLSDSLAHTGCLRALNQAIELTPVDRLESLIHHSDHGMQYIAWPYDERLQSVGMCPSMGEVGNCYDNALAERMNGILKNEYGLDDLFVDLSHAQQAVDEAVWLYNFERPHWSLDLRKPADVFFDSCAH